ncbi:hypothetical protein [Streptomyces sp. 061-3]|uniref:hypothetical protein n=1 Tax=Streptomyces sp. 061-3 TaxID=2789268 RepID=UPI00397F3A63
MHAHPIAAVVAGLADRPLRPAIGAAGLSAMPAEVAQGDLVDLPDLGSAFNERVVRRYHPSMMGLRGLDEVG